MRAAEVYFHNRLCGVLQEDKEELALTLNAKKNKLSKTDWLTFFKHGKLNDKQINNLIQRLIENLQQNIQFIDVSFLPKEIQASYKHLIQSRLSQFL